MTKSYFVTATDTDAGKTLVCAGILHAVLNRGLQGLAIKPVAAGCIATPNGLRNNDALELISQMSPLLSYDQVNPIALEPAIAPHLAAKQQGISINVNELAKHCNYVIQLQPDLCLIEGAGGWRVPLNDQETWVDLIKLLDIPVIIVVAMRLGCINQALLTVESILNDGVPLAGWVANTVECNMPSFQGNLNTLIAKIHAPLLGVIPYLESTASKYVAAHIQIDNLL